MFRVRNLLEPQCSFRHQSDRCVNSSANLHALPGHFVVSQLTHGPVQQPTPSQNPRKALQLCSQGLVLPAAVQRLQAEQHPKSRQSWYRALRSRAATSTSTFTPQGVYVWHNTVLHLHNVQKLMYAKLCCVHDLVLHTCMLQTCLTAYNMATQGICD